MSTAPLSPRDKRILQTVIDRYMAPCDGLRTHCERCLQTRRWGGSVPLMLIDAAFMSIGLNYFISVVPAVVTYEEWMNEGRAPGSLRELSSLSYDHLAPLWKNRRSWQVARDVATCLMDNHMDDAAALRTWAADAPLESWSADPVGAVKGVGITTYQYLRMMGGIDTSMPDKIVRRVIADVLTEADVALPTAGDLELVYTIDRIAESTGYRPIELCWMTWMVQSEGKVIRMAKYHDLLKRI